MDDEELGPRDAHQSMVAAANCPNCPSDTATPSLGVDSDGYLTLVTFTCIVCGTIFV